MGVFSRRLMIAATAFGLMVGGLGAAPAAKAVEVEAAKTLVMKVSDQLIKLVSSNKPEAQKRTEFEQILTDSAAISDIAAVAIGRTYKTMSDSQKSDYEAAFTDYLARAYMKRLNGYQGETLELNGVEDAGKRGVYVKTYVKRPTTNEPPLEVEWRILDRNGPPQVFDISIEGVSLVVTQRNEFTSLLESYNGDVDKFIARLEQETANSN